AFGTDDGRSAALHEGGDLLTEPFQVARIVEPGHDDLIGDGAAPLRRTSRCVAVRRYAPGMEPGDPDNIAERVSALESQVGDLNRRVRASEQDAQAARVLAGAADRDVADLGGEVRGLRGEFNDFRGEFNGLRGEFNGLRGEFNDFRRATVSGFNALRA